MTFAESHLDAMVTLSNDPFDVAAGVLLARETGDQVVDTQGHEYSVMVRVGVANRAPQVTTDSGPGVQLPKDAQADSGSQLLRFFPDQIVVGPNTPEETTSTAAPKSCSKS